MRTAKTILELIGKRGEKGLPLERVYKLLFNKDLYLQAYGKIYRNKGAMTHGVTNETPDGMGLEYWEGRGIEKAISDSALGNDERPRLSTPKICQIC